MTKSEFIETFGQDPVDVLGQDWENEECICSEGDGKGKSVCGFPCPVHGKRMSYRDCIEENY